MNFKWFSGNTPDNEPPPSVLAEWNKYAEESTGPSQTDRLLSSMEQGSTSVQNFFGQSISRVATGVTGVSASVASGVQNMAVPSTQQFAYFFALLGAGIVFLILAFSLFLPLIVITPSKFAICFSVGSLLVMSSFAALKGWKQQVVHMFSRERLPFSTAYIGTIFGTLYAALAMKSYILSLACCGLQVAALLYYLASYFPGGTAGVKFMLGMFYQATIRCLGGVQRTIFG